MKADVGNLTAYQHLIGETASDVLPAGFIHALAFPAGHERDEPGRLSAAPAGHDPSDATRVEQRAPFGSPRPWISGPGWRTCAGTGPARSWTWWPRSARPARTPSAGAGVSTYLAKGVFLPGIDKPSAPPCAGGLLGSGSHGPVAAGRRHRAGLRRRVRGLQPHPPERPDGQGPGHAAVHRARHVPGVAGAGGRRRSQGRFVQLGRGLRGAGVPAGARGAGHQHRAGRDGGPGSAPTTWPGTRVRAASTSAVRWRRCSPGSYGGGYPGRRRPVRRGRTTRSIRCRLSRMDSTALGASGVDVARRRSARSAP